MKKIWAILAAIVTIVSSATLKADDGKLIQVNQLPANAQQFIKQHFGNEQVSFAKEENEIITKTYKVTFMNGSKVEFNKNGEWKEVDCEHSAVPHAIIPGQITKYVKTKYPDTKIIEIDRNSKEYEVKLNNGLTLEFDTNFNLKNIDD